MRFSLAVGRADSPPPVISLLPAVLLPAIARLLPPSALLLTALPVGGLLDVTLPVGKLTGAVLPAAVLVTAAMPPDIAAGHGSAER